MDEHVGQEDADPQSEGEDALDLAVKAAFRTREAADAASGAPAASIDSQAASPGDIAAVRYDVGSEIGRGGIGVVHEAWDRTIRRNVAVKVLRAPHHLDPLMVERFSVEARVCGRLQHPGIPPVHDAGRLSDGRVFMAMKLIAGKTLSKVLEERDDPSQGLSHLLQAYEQVCQTMGYAHSHDVIHRDLKPSNIMVGSFGEVLVMDWGLAKALDTGDEPEADGDRFPAIQGDIHGFDSTPGSVIGTLAYMSPEQASGATSQVDKRSDVFCLGAVLCQILTGAPLYESDSTGDLREMARSAHLDGAHARLDTCAADGDLIQLTKRCLDPDPAGRPEDAGELAASISAYLSRMEQRLRDSELKAAEAASRARAERRTRQVTLALAALIVVTLVLSGGGYLWLKSRQQQRTDAADAAASGALEDVGHLWGRAKGAENKSLADWQEALAALDKAEALGRDPDVTDATRRRVSRVASELKTEAAEVEQAVAMAERDRRLEDMVHGTPGHGTAWGSDPIPADARYAEIVAAYGVDLISMDVEEATAQLRLGTQQPERLGLLLRAWSRNRRGLQSPPPGPGWENLAALADQLDTDPWRRDLRKAYDAKDVEGLRRLAATLDRRYPHERYCELAQALKQLGDLDSAIDVYRKGQWHRPEDASLNNDLGFALLQLPSPPRDEVIRSVQMALASAPTNVALWVRLGGALRDSGDPKRARDAYDRALEIEPDHVPAIVGIGILLLNAGQLDEAESHFVRASELRPDSARPMMSLGSLWQRRGDLDKAIACFQEAINRDPKYVHAHCDLGVAWYRKRLLDKAIAKHLEVLELDPSHGHAHANLGDAYAAKSLLDKAIASFRKALELGYGPAWVHGNLGHALARNGLLQESLVPLRESVRKYRAIPARFTLALVLHNLKRLDEAAAEYEAVLKIDPDHAGALGNLAALRYDRGDLDRAIELLRASLESDPSSAGNRENLGTALADQAKLQGHLEAAAHNIAEPRDAPTAVKAAAYAMQRGRNLLAARLYRRVLTEGPSLTRTNLQVRLDAARAAVHASQGIDTEPDNLPPPSRTEWRRTALAWLNAEIEERNTQLAERRIREVRLLPALERWTTAPDLSPVRNTDALRKIPEPERQQWRTAWDALADLMDRLD